MRPSIGRNRDAQQKSLVAFAVGQVYYAIEIAHVREIVTPLPLTLLPHTPDGLAGVADHRDQVVPIIDLRARFGLPVSSNRKVKWILVEVNQRTVGLVVDDVLGVMRVQASDFRGPPDLGGGESARAIASVTSHDKRLVFVLDLARIEATAESLEPMAMLHSALASSEES